jgi:hypothetical protein
VNEDDKGLYILHSGVRKAIKEMMDKQATGIDGVPGDVFKLLGDNGLKIMTQLINNIYETGKWSKGCTKVCHKEEAEN